MTSHMEAAGEHSSQKGERALEGRHSADAPEGRAPSADGRFLGDSVSAPDGAPGKAESLPSKGSSIAKSDKGAQGEVPVPFGSSSGTSARHIHVRPVPAEPAKLDLPPFLARAMAARGVAEPNDLDLPLEGLLPPTALPDIDKAAARLEAAIRANERILIVGDFDADGATASALCVSALHAFGASQVDYLVPNRFEYGYGLTPELVQVALTRDPNVIVTVDNGVASIEGVALARSQGIDVIVTDHHLPGEELPAAHAIVNPNLAGSEFPSQALAGVGVAWYVMAALRARLRANGHFDERSLPEPNMAEWLDLVALGTVADVVPLDRNNRILVHQGIRRMRAGRLRTGIRALVQASGRSLPRLQAQDLGFAVAPRLNAAGRLDDMSAGIACLLTGDEVRARELAGRLDELNRERRAIEADMNEGAQLLIDQEQEADRTSICVYDEGWHQGVVGIVAGRMRERYHRPVIAFADAGPAAPDEIKGSARSIPGLHIRDAIADVAARFPNLVGKFGGHAMAAGLSLHRVQLERFRNAFETAVAGRVTERDLAGDILTDGELAAAELELDNARLIERHGPWGQAFEEPTFHGDFDIVSERVVGESHLKLVLQTGERVVDAIAFNQERVGARRVRAIYRLSINDYRDMETLQLEVKSLAPLPD